MFAEEAVSSGEYEAASDQPETEEAVAEELKEEVQGAYRTELATKASGSCASHFILV